MIIARLMRLIHDGLIQAYMAAWSHITCKATWRHCLGRFSTVLSCLYVYSDVLHLSLISQSILVQQVTSAGLWCTGWQGSNIDRKPFNFLSLSLGSIGLYFRGSPLVATTDTRTGLWWPCSFSMCPIQMLFLCKRAAWEQVLPSILSMAYFH